MPTRKKPQAIPVLVRSPRVSNSPLAEPGQSTLAVPLVDHRGLLSDVKHTGSAREENSSDDEEICLDQDSTSSSPNLLTEDFPPSELSGTVLLSQHLEDLYTKWTQADFKAYLQPTNPQLVSEAAQLFRKARRDCQP